MSIKPSYLILVFVLLASSVVAQRRYATSSVLASGDWFKIGVKEAGVYKVDGAFLNTLGVGNNIPSASIRLFGNGGAMLGENASAAYLDDLTENAIEMVDGGDGVFNATDYFLFYAPGSDRWVKDSSNQSFRYQKNLYKDSAYYYISVGTNGKRIQQQSSYTFGTVLVNEYDERHVLENDLVNLIGSGKEWYGDAFSSVQGGTLTRSYAIDWTGLLTQYPITLRSSFASRNVGTTASITSSINGTSGASLSFPSITGTFLDRYATHLEQEQRFNVNQSSLVLRFDYQSSAAGAQCWINRFELFGRRQLSFSSTAALSFRDWRSVSNGAIAGFDVGALIPNMRVWEITDPLQPVAMRNLSATRFFFYNDASRLREYHAFTPTQVRTPVALGKINNQNLHALTSVEYLIIAHPSFLAAAQRLAAFHQQQYQRTVQVVNIEQVYQEFASGNPDPTAIRDFVKMFYDRGVGITKYLLLFGSGSYDPQNRISNNYRFIPTYQSNQSLDPLSSFTSDDFFGMLDDGDDVTIGNALQTVDIAFGRIPARTLDEANRMVDKVIAYHQSTRFGEWRNRLLFLADDKDLNLHLNDAETVWAATKNPLFQLQKTYVDAFPLVSSSGGARYPAVNEQLVNRLNQGALIFNYSGHGNHIRLADEAVFTTDEANRLTNASRLPLVVTASCDFYPFDDPAKNALGAQMLTGDSSGSIALLTTARLVFASSNRIINEYFLQTALQPDPLTGNYLSLGEAVRRAKNLSVTQAGEVLNTRKFLLLGDPAMRLAFPMHQVALTRVNGLPITLQDTLKASTRYRMEGVVRDAGGNRLSDFNGTVSVVLFDKARTVQTLGNDPTSRVASFQEQSAVLFKGNFSVTAGAFDINIILPKDVGFQPGKGRISLYAFDATRDAAGADTSFVLIGNATAPLDNVGPAIRLFLNDTSFKNGGLTHELPMLIAYLSDSSGINTSGNGIGHDITLVIDDQVRDIRVLNDLYESTRDNFTSGTIRFPLPLQTNGAHRLKLKAWDGANNSNEVQLNYIVEKEEKLAVTKVMNFPNPFWDWTRFSFEHNQPNKELSVQVYIYQSNGRLIKRISRKLQTAGTRNIQVDWDGRDESGRKIQKGIYIYQIIVASGQQQINHAGQLILL